MDNNKRPDSAIDNYDNRRRVKLKEESIFVLMKRSTDFLRDKKTTVVLLVVSMKVCTNCDSKLVVDHDHKAGELRTIKLMN